MSADELLDLDADNAGKTVLLDDGHGVCKK